MGIRVDLPKPEDPRRALLALVKALRRESEVIAGEKALGLAFLIHEMGMDSPGERWGNACFRCPHCGAVRDCRRYMLLAGIHTLCSNYACSEDLFLDHLRLTEGWVEWAVMAEEFPHADA